MKYSKFALLGLISFNVQAIDFKLSDDMKSVDGVDYYDLTVANGSLSKKTPIALEGNSNQIEIKETFKLQCPWGNLDGARLAMSSSTIDGSMQVNHYYYFTEDLNKMFLASYTTFNQKENTFPISLGYKVCETNGETKGFLVDQVIANGPYKMKGVNSAYIKLIAIKDKLTLTVEKKDGDIIYDTYNTESGVFPESKTMFFMNINSTMNLVNLMAWNKSSENNCYKVYIYSYSKLGDLNVNKKFLNDANLKGCDKGSGFIYKNASLLRKYLETVVVAH